MFRIVNTSSQSQLTLALKYRFCSGFKKQFGLGHLRASLTRKLYRRFLKSVNQKYLIPSRLVLGGILCAGLLLMLPGVEYPGQKKIKQGTLYIVDEVMFMYMKNQPHSDNSTNYLNSVMSQLEYWDRNGLNAVDKTNEVLRKVRDVVEHYPMSNDAYTNLFAVLELRIKKIIEMNKETLKSQEFNEHIYKIFEHYVEFRKHNPPSSVQKNLFQTRRESLEFMCDYLLAYSKNKAPFIDLLRQLTQQQTTFGVNLVQTKPILKELIAELNTSDRSRGAVLKLFATISKDPQTRAKMNRINLVANLVKYIPKSELKQILSNFN